MAEKPLSRRQAELLERIREFFREQNMPPTIRELAERMGTVSLASVLRMVRVLEQRGYLLRDPERSRSIRLTERSHRSARALPARKPAGLPLVGVIAAGLPLQAFEQDERLDLGGLYSPDQHFLLRVKGDSMIEDQIADGDFVIVRKTQTCADGDVVVAILPGGEATLKRFRRDRRGIVLEPANRRLKPIRVSRADANAVEIQGIVVGVFRQLT